MDYYNPENMESAGEEIKINNFTLFLYSLTLILILFKDVEYYIDIG